MLEPCDAKVSSTVLRGPGGRKAAWLLGNYPETGFWELVQTADRSASRK
jgi:hypothetical protein